MKRQNCLKRISKFFCIVYILQMSSNKSDFSCHKCLLVLGSEITLRRHIEKCRGSLKSSLICCKCQFSFATKNLWKYNTISKKILKLILLTQKKVKYTSQSFLKEFQNQNYMWYLISEFDSYKSGREKADKTRFVTKQTTKRTKTLYSCFRSGKFLSRSQGNRLCKGIGTNKTGYSCPARIERTIADNAYNFVY